MTSPVSFHPPSPRAARVRKSGARRRREVKAKSCYWSCSQLSWIPMRGLEALQRSCYLQLAPAGRRKLFLYGIVCACITQPAPWITGSVLQHIGRLDGSSRTSHCDCDCGRILRRGRCDRPARPRGVHASVLSEIGGLGRGCHPQRCNPSREHGKHNLVSHCRLAAQAASVEATLNCSSYGHGRLQPMRNPLRIFPATDAQDGPAGTRRRARRRR